MNKPVILLGLGGHGRVLLSLIRLLGRSVLGYVAPHPVSNLETAETPPYLGTDEAITSRSPEEVELVNAIGSVGDTSPRQQIHEYWSTRGYIFATLVHPAAIIAPEAQLSAGVQVMAGAIIQAGARIGANAIVNTAASVDHDCMIGAHAHVAPGVVLCGGVRVGEGAHIGTGAAVIQSVRIGPGAIVGAGATVLHDVPAGQTVFGCPARPRS